MVCLCHCARCLWAVGAGPVAWATYQTAHWRCTQGTPRWFHSSPRARRGFCGQCGSSLFLESRDGPTEIDVCLAALPLDTALRPSCHIWVLDSLPWSDSEDGLPCHILGVGSTLLDEAVRVRVAAQSDVPAIRALHIEAFGRDQESQLVAHLGATDGLLLSLVAELDGQLVGHLACSPTQLQTGRTPLRTAGLGPVSVAPDYQRRGIGTRLVADATARLRRDGLAAVFVLGDPSYYGRFGFDAAERWGITWDDAEPLKAFQALELQPGALSEQKGRVHYRAEFSSVAPPPPTS